MSSHLVIFGSRLDAVVNDVLDEKIDTAIEAGIEGAKSIVPILSGDLHDSIQEQDREPGRGSYGSTLDYASAVEFGTEHGPEQPYMRPSIDAMRQALR